MQTRHSQRRISEGRRWVTFDVAGCRYGLEVAQVREVVDVPALSAPAHAPGCVQGRLRSFGEEVDVLDPAGLLAPGGRCEARGRDARVVIVEARDGPVGLLVDRVDEVRIIAPEEIDTPAEAANDALGVRGVFRRAEDATILLDGEGLVRARPLRESLSR